MGPPLRNIGKSGFEQRGPVSQCKFGESVRVAVDEVGLGPTSTRVKSTSKVFPSKTTASFTFFHAVLRIASESFGLYPPSPYHDKQVSM